MAALKSELNFSLAEIEGLTRTQFSGFLRVLADRSADQEMPDGTRLEPRRNAHDSPRAIVVDSPEAALAWIQSRQQQGLG